MDIRIQAAIIGAASALLGVLVGGFIQNWVRKKEIKRRKSVAEGVAALYLCQVRQILIDYSIEKETSRNLALGINIGDINLSEIDMVIDLIKQYDPILTVPLLHIKQRLYNIGLYSKKFWDLREINPDSRELELFIHWINVDAKSGLKEVDKCLRHSFNNAEEGVQQELLERDEFKGFLHKWFGDSRLNRWKLKFKLIGKI